MSKRKYRPTSRICSLTDFENSKATWFEVRCGGGNYRMWHRSALESLQVHTLMVWLKMDAIYACEKIEKEVK